MGEKKEERKRGKKAERKRGEEAGCLTSKIS